MSIGSFLFREKEQVYIPTKKIVIVGASKSCGVSVVSQVFASALKSMGSISVIELGDSYYFDALGFEKHFLDTGFTDYIDKLCNNESFCLESKNEFSKINWYVRNSGNDIALNSAQIFRALYMPKENFAIFDCSGVDQENALAILAEADIPVIVVDPLPSKLIKAREMLEKLRFSMPKAIIVVNKMNNGVHKAELCRYLGTKDYFSLPSITSDIIYKAEYNSKLFSDLSEMAQIRQKAQDMLSKSF